jgi:hypothetical protein
VTDERSQQEVLHRNREVEEPKSAFPNSIQAEEQKALNLQRVALTMRGTDQSMLKRNAGLARLEQGNEELSASHFICSIPIRLKIALN